MPNNVPFQELLQALIDNCTEVEILEILRLTPEDLVEAFKDRIEDNQDTIANAIRDYLPGVKENNDDEEDC